MTDIPPTIQPLSRSSGSFAHDELLALHRNRTDDDRQLRANYCDPVWGYDKK